MAPRIIVADPDPGFGLMLAQMLESDGAYIASHVPTGVQALRLARNKHPDLVIIDAALADITPAELIKALRLRLPDLRIMLIPLGGSLPVEYGELNVHGILPKPFFVGDLPGCIANALGKVPDQADPAGADMAAASPVVTEIAAASSSIVREEAAMTPRIVPKAAAAHAHARTAQAVRAPSPIYSPTPLAPAPKSRLAVRSPLATPDAPAPETPQSRTETALNKLAGDISAEALFVIKDGALVAHRSNMNELRRESMSELLAGWFKVAAGLAVFVGERGGRFKQLHFEGERYHIYGFAIHDSTILIAICRSEVPFGQLRLSIKSAGPEIARHLA